MSENRLDVSEQKMIPGLMLFTIPRGPAHVFKNNAKTYEVILKMKLI